MWKMRLFKKNQWKNCIIVFVFKIYEKNLIANEIKEFLKECRKFINLIKKKNCGKNKFI